MQGYELSVHVTAPSTVKDDMKWRRVAHNVARFNPARTFMCEMVPDPSLKSHDSIDTCIKTVHTPQLSSDLPDVGISKSSDNCQEAHSTKLSHELAAHSRIAGTKRVYDTGNVYMSNKRVKQTWSPSNCSGFDDASSKSFSGRTETGKQPSATSNLMGALQSRVQVPFTRSPKERQTSIHITPDPERRDLSGISRSLCSPRVNETSFVEGTITRSNSVEIHPFLPLDVCADSRCFGNETPPETHHGWTSRLGCEPASISEDNTTFRITQTDFVENEVMIGTLTSTDEERNIRALRADSRRDITFSSSASVDTNTKSDEDLDNSSPLAKMFRKSGDFNIGRTSSTKQTLSQIGRRNVLGPISSPACIRSLSNSEDIRNTSSEGYFDTIFHLPLRAECHVSCTNSHGKFSSFIPTYFSQLSQKFGLFNVFRPLHATTSIRNNLRGYWRLLILIGTPEAVAESRIASTNAMTASQRSEEAFMLRQRGQIAADATKTERFVRLEQVMYPELDPETPVLWHTEEYVEFWRSLTKLIERGRAGFDARATIERRERDKEGIRIEARVWCWAEVLSHLWLAMYGLSVGLTSQMPLQWWVPGTDTNSGPVVTMSGQAHRGGSRWIEKSSGVSGCWGLEDI